MISRIALTESIAALGVLALHAVAAAEPRSKAGNPQFAVTAPFVDVGGFADCADASGDDE